MLQKKKLFLFDIDGTIALGNQLINGARELLDYLVEKKKTIFFITNNSTRSQQDYVAYFEQWGIAVSEEMFMTAGVLTAEYFKKNLFDKKIFLMASSELTEEFAKRGLHIVDHYEEDIDCVLICLDKTMTFQKLADACRLLQDENVLFYATNMDLSCPTDCGVIPDCGSICKMIECVTGRKPRYIGKPAPDIVELCLKKAGCNSEEAIVVGDRIDTDMVCAQNAGVEGALLLSGATSKKDMENSNILISYVFEDAKSLLENLLIG